VTAGCGKNRVRIKAWFFSLREKSIGGGKATTRAKANDDFRGLRGPEGPLFHGSANIREFFRRLFSDAANHP
jgi:hypothetical protein